MVNSSYSSSVTSSPPRAWAEIDTSALHQNLKAIRQHAGKEVMAVIKAGAYGHGLVSRPRLLVVNKLELLDEQGRDDLLERLDALSGRRPLLISAVMGKGLDALLDQVWQQLGV